MEKFKEWTHSSAELPEDAVDRDHMLTNVMLYWLTGTAASSARLYYENVHSGSWGQLPGTTPTGVAVFAEDVAICRYGERSNNIVHWSEFDRGGHFAAMEAPDLLVGDARTFLGPLSPVWCDPYVATGVLLALAEPVAAATALNKPVPEFAGQLHGLPAPSGEDVCRRRLWGDDGHHGAPARIEQVVAAQVLVPLGTQPPCDLQVARARRLPVVELLCVHEHIPPSSLPLASLVIGLPGIHGDPCLHLVVQLSSPLPAALLAAA